jgi:ribosomal protein L34E
MKRAELAKVLLDEIKRTQAQLAHLRTVLMMRREKRTSGLDHCDECEMPSEGISESDNSVCSD